ncbi:MAG: 16S rRNA (cytidine(1402)-2'-O)-methyltransferase [Flavobacteriales bacterium]|nr:16S rRNA (cytidine(1402)-2'-O)-methyltransferase [Flavobacteriales bacterium]
MLYIVPTPIGNLADITLRAIDILKKVDLILAEDTRTSAKLLQHHGIETSMRPFHQHNEHKVLEDIIAQMESGNTLALISDAGTPGISDPGFLLVRACVEQGIAVETLPGATAFVPALVNSGFPTDRFVYEGFLPQKKGRQTRLKEIAEEQRTVVLYESPHRIVRLLKELSEVLSEGRKVSVSRELSKIHEETLRGLPAQLQEHFEAHPPKGEFVVVVDAIKRKKAS